MSILRVPRFLEGWLGRAKSFGAAMRVLAAAYCILLGVAVVVFFVRHPTNARYTFLVLFIVGVVLIAFVPVALPRSRRTAPVGRPSTPLPPQFTPEVLDLMAGYGPTGHMTLQFLWLLQQLTPEQWKAVTGSARLMNDGVLPGLVEHWRDVHGWAELNSAWDRYSRDDAIALCSALIEACVDKNMIHTDPERWVLVFGTCIAILHSDVVAQKAVRSVYRPFEMVIPWNELTRGWPFETAWADYRKTLHH